MGESRELSTLQATIREFGLVPDKSLGQHFLLDAHLLAEIVRRAGPLAGLNVAEIGPGPGGLTRALLDSAAARITAIEFDPRAVAAIQVLATSAPGRVEVIAGDALRADLTALLPAPRAIIANLPYNIATALLVRWLAQADAYQSMTLMFQAEVAERICAAPGTPAYGRLAVLAQWCCQAAIVMHIPAGAFSPPPKVESALVRLVPHAVQPAPDVFVAMGQLTAAAFGQRRKMLRGALKALGGEALLREAEIDPERRAETLRVAEFERLLRVWRKGK